MARQGTKSLRATSTTSRGVSVVLASACLITLSFEAMMWIMRYNDFQNDPLSSQLPDCA
jgi:hypothetical protein